RQSLRPSRARARPGQCPRCRRWAEYPVALAKLHLLSSARLNLLREGNERTYLWQTVTPARAAPELLRNQDLCILVNVPLRPDLDGIQKAALIVEQLLRNQMELRERAQALAAGRLAELEPEQSELTRRMLATLKESAARVVAPALEESAREMANAS